MIVYNRGDENEVSLNLVLESDPHRREVFDHHDTLDELLASLKELVNNAVKCAAEDKIERVISVAVVPKNDSGSDAGVGCGLPQHSHNEVT